MKHKQYRRQAEYIKGYKEGYRNRAQGLIQLQRRSADYRRGYYEARRDLKEGETALY